MYTDAAAWPQRWISKQRRNPTWFYRGSTVLYPDSLSRTSSNFYLGLVCPRYKPCNHLSSGGEKLQATRAIKKACNVKGKKKKLPPIPCYHFRSSTTSKYPKMPLTVYQFCNDAASTRALCETTGRYKSAFQLPQPEGLSPARSVVSLLTRPFLSFESESFLMHFNRGSRGDISRRSLINWKLNEIVPVIRDD